MQQPPAKRFRKEASVITEGDVFFVRYGHEPSQPMTQVAKLTPLEVQVLEFKRLYHSQTLFFVACGYRMRLFGRDSQVASRRLGIMCIPGAPFESSSVPLQRVMYHASRLVAMGYYVGIIDQESAALRQEDGKGSGLFQRKVSHLLSRGTMLAADNSAAGAPWGQKGADGDSGSEDSNVGGEQLADQPGSPGNTVNVQQDSGSRHILFLYQKDESLEEKDGDGQQTPKGEQKARSVIHILVLSFVENCSYTTTLTSSSEDEGNICNNVNKCFEQLLQDLIQYTNIVEVVVNGEGTSNKVRAALCEQLALNEGPTLEAVEDMKRVAFRAMTEKEVFLPVKGRKAAVTEGEGQNLALAMASSFLQPFGMSEVFERIPVRHLSQLIRSGESGLSSACFEEEAPSEGSMLARHTIQNATRNTVYIPGRTLYSLEVFSTPGEQQSNQAKGTLLHLANKCKTPFGLRLLHRWLCHPSTSLHTILERQAAISLMKDSVGLFQLISSFFGSSFGVDLDAILSKLSVARCSAVEYITMLRHVANLLQTVHVNFSGSYSALIDPIRNTPLLNEILQKVLKNENAAKLLQKKLSDINIGAKEAWQVFVLEDMSKALAVASPNIHELVTTRKGILEEFDTHLLAARKAIKFSALEYKTVGQITHLLEVPPTKEKDAPKDWTVISRTKQATRFHTPQILTTIASLAANTDRIKIAGNEAWRNYQETEWGRQQDKEPTTEGEEKGSLQPFLRQVCDGLAVLDVLLSLTQLAQLPNYVAPKFHDESNGGGCSSSRALVFTGLRHPMQEQLLQNKTYVPNDVELSCEAVQCTNEEEKEKSKQHGGAWILTGPNMGGKSALMRSVALAVILAQMGSYVPAQSAIMPMHTSILTRMGSSDSLLSSASTFLLEMEETSSVLRSPDLATSLVLLDELGRGTSSYDGVACADAILKYLLASRCTLLFVTHYPILTRDFVEQNASAPFSVQKAKCKYMAYAVQTDESTATEEEMNNRKRKKVILLYKAVDGVTSSSFGLQIAECAMVPKAVTQVADEKSFHLEATCELTENIRKVQHFLEKQKGA